MKKYLIASVVAMMAFAFAAFAASLNVNGGVLQAGQDVDVTCTDEAALTYATQVNGDGEFAVNSITIDFKDEVGDPDAGCDGQWAYIATFSGNPQAPGGVGGDGSAQTGMAIAQISGSSVTFNVNVGMQEAEAKNLDTVSVAVKNSDDSGEGGWATGIFN